VKVSYQIKICETVQSLEVAEPLVKIPVSNNTIKRRINCMSENINLTLLLRIKQSSKFANQLHESTDYTNDTKLMVLLNINTMHSLMKICCFANEILTFFSYIDCLLIY
jgi:cell division protein ZapA (FtsZ GTPase activity inhibitor)